MNRLLIRGGRIVDPATGFDRVADLLLEGGRVAARGALEGVEAEAIEATGQIVCPGFVDLHTHLRFPGFPEKETVGSGTAAAAAGGFATVCAMANNNPVVDRVEVLHRIQDAVRREAEVRVRQLGAVSVGLRGHELSDLRGLARAGAVAFSDDGKPVWNEAIMREALAFSRDFGYPISVHEEDPAVVGRGVANASGIARRLGLAEWPCEGEAGMVARDLALLDEVGGRLHVAHVSCALTVPLLQEARGRGLPVTAEVTPHHLSLDQRLLEGDPEAGFGPAHPCTKVNPPLRSDDDVQVMVEALREGIIEAVATDHAPHTRADKALPYSEAAFGFSAIETALPLLLDLVRNGQIELVTLIERLTAGPARIFGLEAGTLREGAPADVCIFDPDKAWTVSAESLRSRGKNTPLLGRELRGRVTCTVVGGAIVHRD